MTAIAVKSRPILFSAPMVKAIREGRKTQTRRIVSFCDVSNGDKFKLIDGRIWVSLGEQQYDPKTGKTVFGGECRLDDDCLYYAPIVIGRGPRGDGNPATCPYGVPGDRLWVREEHYRFGHWEPVPGKKTKSGRMKWQFTADTDEVRFDPPESFRKGRHHKDSATPAWHKRLGRFMPRRFCRTVLEITEVGVQRLQEISEADVLAEGFIEWTDPTRITKKHYGLNRADVWETTAVAAFKRVWISLNGQESWDANPWVWCVSFRKLENA